MRARANRPIDGVRDEEQNVGRQFRRAFEPYRSLSEELIDLASDILDGLSERDPDAEHAVALIMARVVTESLAIHHLIELGYPMQAFTIVASTLELTHTAAYIGGDNARAKAYFEHTNTKQAYPGGVRTTINAVAKELGIPQETADREYDQFYNEMCLVKHGNPLAMSLGTIDDDGDIGVTIGPVFTSASVRLGFVCAQQAVRYSLLVLLVFVRHHAPDAKSGQFNARLATASERWELLNIEAGKTIAAVERSSG